MVIVLGSFIFYGSWSVPFLFLMVATASADFVFGRLIHRAGSIRRKRLLLVLSLLSNLGMLSYFKYSGFALEVWSDLTTMVGRDPTLRAFAVVLPVGISFYTFQSIGYVIDVYRGALAPERNWIRFLAFVSFFPQLVAGPIERAPQLSPQFSAVRRITVPDCAEAVWLVIWGLSWLLTMLMVFLGWFLFRVRSLQQVYTVLFLNGSADLPFWTGYYLLGMTLFAMPVVLVEMLQFLRKDLVWPAKFPFWPQSLLYGALIAAVVVYWNQEGTPFIYFQF